MSSSSSLHNRILSYDLLAGSAVKGLQEKQLTLTDILATLPEAHMNKSGKALIGLGIGFSALALLLLLVFCFCYERSRSMPWFASVAILLTTVGLVTEAEFLHEFGSLYALFPSTLVFPQVALLGASVCIYSTWISGFLKRSNGAPAIVKHAAALLLLACIPFAGFGVSFASLREFQHIYHDIRQEVLQRVTEIGSQSTTSSFSLAETNEMEKLLAAALQSHYCSVRISNALSAVHILVLVFMICICAVDQKQYARSVQKDCEKFQQLEVVSVPSLDASSEPKPESESESSTPTLADVHMVVINDDESSNQNISWPSVILLALSGLGLAVIRAAQGLGSLQFYTQLLLEASWVLLGGLVCLFTILHPFILSKMGSKKEKQGSDLSVDST